MILEGAVDSVDTTFEVFFRVTEPVLRRAFVAGFGGDLGREATAEALAYGWRNWNRIHDLDDPAGYLYRVGERWARRRRSRRPMLFAASDRDTPPFEPGLAAALETLPRRQRQAVVLIHGYGMSHAQAARLLGIARTSIQNHVERGMAALRASLGAP